MVGVGLSGAGLVRAYTYRIQTLVDLHSANVLHIRAGKGLYQIPDFTGDRKNGGSDKRIVADLGPDRTQ